MKKVLDKIYYSPTDLSDFQRCSYHIINDLENIKKPLPAREITETSAAYIKKGLELELKYLNNLKDNKFKVINIDDLQDVNTIDATKEKLLKGYDYIYQSHLEYKFWRGKPDFLVKVEGKSSLGDFHYEPIDVKLSPEPKTKHITQVLTYCYLLEKNQGFLPTKFHIVNGPNLTINTFITDQYYSIFNEYRNQFEDYINNIPKDLYPNKCEFCNFECEWISVCEEKWNKDRYLNLVANINRNQISKLQKKDIQTIDDLASTGITHIDGIGDKVLEKLKKQSQLQLQKIDHDNDIFEKIIFDQNKGLDRLPKPSNCDVFFDIEGDPTNDEKLEYLFGNIIIEKDKYKFVDFWSHNHTEEKNAFIQVMNFFKDKIDKYPDAYIYHYSQYEVTALKRLSLKYDVCADILDFLLRNEKFVDLYVVVKESIMISEPSYSIKNLERFYMGDRTSDVQKGSESVDMYLKWQDTRDQKILDDIALYNKEDCISTHKLYEWLLSLKEDSNFFKPEKYTEFSNEYDERFYETQKSIEKINEKENFKTLLTNLLEFHRREIKSDWWLYYSRQDYDLQDHFNDMDAIGGLEFIENFEDEKKGSIWRYSYPDQDFRLKEADSIYNTADLKSIGSISDINLSKKIIDIKISLKKSRSLPSYLNIATNRPINNKPLQDAVYRFANSIINNEKKYSSTYELLYINQPKLNKNKKISEIIEYKDSAQEIYSVCKNLDNSYLFLQGPPGTGKTFLTAKVILYLLKDGKKIAIASNSHKVIHNLLDRIEENALNEKFEYKGLKKSSSSNKDSKYETTNIKSLDKILDIKETQLLAATRFELAKDIYDQVFDFIFIDEAGQTSIADTIASTLCAKNIILIGDPQQLPQPSQITHPENSGSSILEFLLDGKNTVSDDYGVFLKDTRRLHPKICSYISERFYDSRLNSHEEASNRIINIKNSSFELNNPGISIITTNHEFNTQKSEEEGEIIKNLYNDLLKSEFSIDGQSRKIELSDILVVAPFNVQVNYLQQILPKNSRVGTIDKFQGQEAPISIISMTCSDQESVPRGINFLFNPNRLNVAISRAQVMSIVIMNKKLFSSFANNIDQLSMINNFARLKDYCNFD